MRVLLSDYLSFTINENLGSEADKPKKDGMFSDWGWQTTVLNKLMSASEDMEITPVIKDDERGRGFIQEKLRSPEYRVRSEREAEERGENRAASIASRQRPDKFLIPGVGTFLNNKELMANFEFVADPSLSPETKIEQLDAAISSLHKEISSQAKNKGYVDEEGNVNLDPRTIENIQKFYQTLRSKF
jgi:hypothetical protein